MRRRLAETRVQFHSTATCTGTCAIKGATTRELSGTKLMATLTDQQIARALEPYMPVVHGASPKSAVAIGPAFCNQVRGYVRLLLKWNRSISLTTVTNPDEILQFHFGESIFAASVVIFQNGRLADFGAGAGFPGLPVQMIAPSMGLSLVESNLKRCAFLAEVTRELGLADVTILKSRVEDLGPESGLFEFITARAFGQFELLLDRAGRMLTGGGRVILWLGEKDTESLARRRDWEWLSPVRIPNSERRFILVGSPKL
jgi:16S rRNA (guanine527-N7)-methyltransferase